MKIAVIDNDQTVREGLVQMIVQNSTQIDEIREASSLHSGIELLNKYEPDLVFLDVELGDGTGFDLLEIIKEKELNVIFITAHNKYAVNAFKFSAIDFLLKPIEIDELINALQKADYVLKNKDIAAQLEILKESLNHIKGSEQKIVLKDKFALYIVKVSDILNCTAEGSYTTFNLCNDQKIVVSRTLKEYETLLESHGFLRIHHSHLVNLSKIVKLDKKEGYTIILENGTSFPIAQRKVDYVIKILEN